MSEPAVAPAPTRRPPTTRGRKAVVLGYMALGVVCLTLGVAIGIETQVNAETNRKANFERVKEAASLRVPQPGPAKAAPKVDPASQAMVVVKPDAPTAVRLDKDSKDLLLALEYQRSRDQTDDLQLAVMVGLFGAVPAALGLLVWLRRLDGLVLAISLLLTIACAYGLYRQLTLTTPSADVVAMDEPAAETAAPTAPASPAVVWSLAALVAFCGFASLILATDDATAGGAAAPTETADPSIGSPTAGAPAPTESTDG